MRTLATPEGFMAGVTQMRPAGPLELTAGQLEDGNTLARLCGYAGAGACASTCQAQERGERAEASKACADQNLTAALKGQYIHPTNFAMVAATADKVGFGDNLAELGASGHPDGYTTVPGYNAFFFRPGKDMSYRDYRRLTHAGMRMADCGAICITGKDGRLGSRGEDIVGISHFSRTNMRGPSAYSHELDGQKVSWGEYVLGNFVLHYEADVQSLRVTLVAAVEGADFIHHYKDEAAMKGHYPGWAELGFMHPQGKQDFDCRIDYREMIEWQLTDGIQNPTLRLDGQQIDTARAINTGDPTLGHASHHLATKGTIPQGRDLYVVGLGQQASIASRIRELERLQSLRPEMYLASADEADALYDQMGRDNQELKRLYAARDQGTNS